MILTACGFAEWPPRVNLPDNINRPQHNNQSFVGASAVIVGKGDTVYALSRRHKVPLRAIIDANALKAPFVLRVGQRIVLPRGRVHRVQKGDTLGQIAIDYDVDTYDVARLNGLRPPYIIRIGQRLTLPTYTDRTTSKAALRSNPSQSAPASVKTKKTVSARAPAWSAPPKMKRRKTATKTRRQTEPVKISRPPAKSGNGFIWPVKGEIISGFGAKPKGLRNDGVNIKVKRGTPVVAAENGVVAYAGNELRGFGNLLLIKHADGWITAYAHNEQLLVRRGQRLKRGQKIATVGSSGNVTTPQLHFEIRRGKSPRDPKKYL